MAIDNEGVMDRQSAKEKPNEHKDDKQGNIPNQVKNSSVSEPGRGEFPVSLIFLHGHGCGSDQHKMYADPPPNDTTAEDMQLKLQTQSEYDPHDDGLTMRQPINCHVPHWGETE